MKNMHLFIIAGLLLISVSGAAQTLTKIDRDSFYLEYPQGWSVDTKDEDYDPDAIFSLDGPGESTMMFMIFQLAIDTEELLAKETKVMTEKLIKKPESVEDFTSWGNFTGKGKTIKGKILGIIKGRIRLFIWADKHKTFLVMEQYYDEDSAAYEKGASQISNSFRFK